MFKMPLTLESAFAGLSDIYAENNAVTIINGRSGRQNFLGQSVANLESCIRKEKRHLYPVALAQSFAWFICVAEGVFRDAGGKILAQGMCEKYPAGKCGYCQQRPCQCSEAVRRDHTPAMSTVTQMRWSMREWQKDLFEVYGAANAERGVSRAINRLYGEVMEAGALCNLTDGVNESLQLVKEKTARELTDVLAWLFAIASLLEADLEKSVLRVYGAGCPVCKKALCGCTTFTLRPGKGGFTHRFMPAEDVFECLESEAA